MRILPAGQAIGQHGHPGNKLCLKRTETSSFQETSNVFEDRVKTSRNVKGESPESIPDSRRKKKLLPNSAMVNLNCVPRKAKVYFPS